MSKKIKKTYSIGIDLGGTKIAAVLFDGENVVADFALATPTDSLDHILVMIKALIEPLEEKAREINEKIVRIGIGVPAVISKKENKVLWAPNLEVINNSKLAELLSEKIGQAVFMDKDAQCFTRAEALAGAGRKYSNIYGLTIGTGIGGGWWLDGKPYTGLMGAGNEPGHMSVNFSEAIDLEQAYQKLTQNNPAQLAEEAFRGDILAQKTYEELGRLYGVALGNIGNLIAPEIFVIGGGVIESSDLFFSRMKKTIQECLVSPEYKKNVKVVKSKLGKFAGAIGAALLTE